MVVFHDLRLRYLGRRPHDGRRLDLHCPRPFDLPPTGPNDWHVDRRGVPRCAASRVGHSLQPNPRLGSWSRSRPSTHRVERDLGRTIWSGGRLAHPRDQFASGPSRRGRRTRTQGPGGHDAFASVSARSQLGTPSQRRGGPNQRRWHRDQETDRTWPGAAARWNPCRHGRRLG